MVKEANYVPMASISDASKGLVELWEAEITKDSFSEVGWKHSPGRARRTLILSDRLDEDAR